ncbi:MAG: hypothetical protein ACE5HC_03180 [Candidatus Binatia bacterium]
MEKKSRDTWSYILIVLVVAVGAFWVGLSMVGTQEDSERLTASLEEKTGELEKKERQIEERNAQISELRKELEENSKQVGQLKARVKKDAESLSSARERLKGAKETIKQLTATQMQARRRATQRRTEPASPGFRRRSADPGTYEVIRDTTVFERPSGASRKVMTIQKRTRVTVVKSVGEWLEVRSKHGNPPGFIHRDDAMFIKRRN